MDNFGKVEFKHFELTEAFRIGHRKIDGDHRRIVEILNELIDACAARNFSLCDRKLNAFKTTLVQHFIDEITIMTELNFIDAYHNKLHDEFELALDDLTGGYDTLVQWCSCIETILDKLIVTILTHDLKFAAHLAEIGYSDR